MDVSLPIIEPEFSFLEVQMEGMFADPTELGLANFRAAIVSIFIKRSS